MGHYEMIKVSPGTTADANSPMTLATADVGGAHPLTVPADATGMLITISGGAAGETAELKHGSTKGDGYTMINRNSYDFVFPRPGMTENWHLHAVTVATTLSAYINYTF